MEQSNARAWGRAAGERAGVAAGAVVRCALRAVAVNVVAVVAAPFLAACSDPGGALAPAPTAARLSATMAEAQDGVAIPDEYIVILRDSVRDVPGATQQLLAEGGSLRFTYRTAVRGFAAHMSARAADAISRNPRVVSVEPDRIVRASDRQTPVPSWGLDRIDQRALPVDQSFSYANTGAGVNVYILDSGIRATHQDFSGRVIRAYTAVSDGYGTGDCDGHGTHVAGIVGGKKYGVAKEVRLHAVRVLGCTGSGSLSGIIAGVDWVTNNRVLPAVANMSLGTSSSAALNTAVQNSIRSGVVYTIAAGNSGTDACSVSPANTPEALTVGATWNGDGLPGYSNHGSCLDILAPGSAIRSDAIVDDTSSVIKGGTSMAAPHVAGVAALYLAANPSATPAQVADAVVTGATPNVLSGLPAGTPNLLLFSGVASAVSGPIQAIPASPLPSDTTVAPPIGPQLVDNPPVPAFTWSCARARCTFDASGSTDDRGITDYSWSFGGGGTIITNRSSKTNYTYNIAGTYIVTLTVTDTSGQRRSTSAVVTVKRV